MKFYIGYHSDTRVSKFVIKGTASSKEQAQEINKVLSEKLNKFEFNQDKMFRRPSDKPSTVLRYIVMNEKQYQEYLASKKTKSLEKRKATLAKKTPEQKKKTYILCPRCRAHSKLLYSEMGGLQTRRCKNGHQFTYDKWVGDRLLSIMAFGNPLKAVEFIQKNPIEVK
jgi:hypothetical protein